MFQRVHKTVLAHRLSSPTEWWISQVCNSEHVLTVHTARERPWRTQVQYIDRIVDMSVMTERHVPVTMQLQVRMMTRVQRTMSSTQVLHIDKEVDVLVAMRDSDTDEESAHEHLTDSSRGAARRISRQVERQMPEWRTLRDSETDEEETGSAGQLQLLRRSFDAMDKWTKQVLTLHANRSTPGSIEVSWSDSEKHETNRREHADRRAVLVARLRQTGRCNSGEPPTQRRAADGLQ